MDVRYTTLLLAFFLSGTISQAAFGADMEDEIIVDFIERKPLNIEEEIQTQNALYNEVVLTFDFDQTTMANKKNNKKELDVKLIKKSSIQKL